MSDDKDKYKMFRNYMTNELGICRGDIEAWTKEAVANEMKKVVGQMNVDRMAMDAVRSAVSGSGYSAGKELRQEMAKLLVEKMDINVKD